MRAYRLLSANTVQAVIPPVVKGASRRTRDIVPGYAPSGSLGAPREIQFTLRCDATMRPTLADSEHVSCPTWSCRGCACADITDNASVSVIASSAAELRSM